MALIQCFELRAERLSLNRFTSKDFSLLLFSIRIPDSGFLSSYQFCSVSGASYYFLCSPYLDLPKYVELQQEKSRYYPITYFICCFFILVVDSPNQTKPNQSKWIQIEANSMQFHSIVHFRFIIDSFISMVGKYRKIHIVLHLISWIFRLVFSFSKNIVNYPYCPCGLWVSPDVVLVVCCYFVRKNSTLIMLSIITLFASLMTS